MSGGPTWTAPMEVVRALASATGAERLRDAELRGAAFRPHAQIELGPHGFVAHCTYRQPRRPGPVNELTLMLDAVPQENAA